MKLLITLLLIAAFASCRSSKGDCFSGNAIGYGNTTRSVLKNNGQ